MQAHRLDTGRINVTQYIGTPPISWIHDTKAIISAEALATDVAGAASERSTGEKSMPGKTVTVS